MQPFADCRVDPGFVFAIGKPRRVAMIDNRDNSGQPHDRHSINAGDPADTDRRVDDHHICLAHLVELGRITGLRR